jgi:hypothetical protein
MEKPSCLNQFLLRDANRNMTLYETGQDRSEGRLELAMAQIDAAFQKGANIDGYLLRLVNNYRTLDLNQ